MKKRLDVILVEKGFATGRDRAKAMIMAGQVFADGQKQDKPGTEIREDTSLEVRGGKSRYVSRGGYKLEKAVQTFNLDINGFTCMDIGASTGGFTDCMLQNGVKKVYAVDVGYGQLAWTLRCDDRVVVMERTNIRYVTREDIQCVLDFVSVDVSFISLKLVLPVICELLRQNGEAVCLIKPQFEAGRESVGKKGVVKDRSVHYTVMFDITECAVKSGFSVLGVSYSPIKGPEGNIEYLMYLKKTGQPAGIGETELRNTVDLSHMELVPT